MEDQAEDRVWELLQRSFAEKEAAIFRDYKLATPQGQARELDFLILHRELGIFVIEVKGYQAATIRAIDDGGFFVDVRGQITMRTNPMEQAVKALYGAQSVVNKHFKDLPIPYEALVFLPNISRQTWQQIESKPNSSWERFFFSDDLSPAVFKERLSQSSKDVQHQDRMIGHEQTTGLPTDRSTAC
jgi:Nuclease-related domain